MDIAGLVQKVTKQPSDGSNILVVSDVLLKRLKVVCQNDDDCVKDAFHYLSIDLKRRSGCVRIRSLAAMDYLFQRSKVFRREVARNIRCILECAGLLKTINGDKGCISATSYAVEVEAKVKELVEAWNNKFGSVYPEIHAVVRYLTESLKLAMPNVEARRRQKELENASREQRSANRLLMQVKKVIDEVDSSVLQVDNVVAKIEECFSILFPRLVDGPGVQSSTSSDDTSFDDVDWMVDDDADEEEVGQALAGSSTSADPVDLEEVGAVPYTLEITLDTTMGDVSTADNDILISCVQELSKQLVKHVVPRLQGWSALVAKAVSLLDGQESNSAVGHKRKAAHEAAALSASDLRSASNKIEQMLAQIRFVLISKCKPLLKV